MKKIISISYNRVTDIDDSHDYLGAFSNTPGKFPVRHDGGRNAYEFFNADNVETMREARQNYRRMIQFESGEVYAMGIFATATVELNGNRVEIESPGLWGTDSDSDESEIMAVELEQLEELKSMLEEMGFAAGEIKEACENINNY